MLMLMLLLGASVMNPNFVDALTARGPIPEHASKMTLYDALIGDWDAEVVDYGENGAKVTSTGEWHFAWVLEGRAIQDVWIVPPRATRAGLAGQAKNNRYGTSIRVFEPATGTWTVIWINPVSGAFNRLVGRRVGNDIVQDGVDGNGTMIRWTFSEITPSSFHWRGGLSTDKGKTWRLAAEFFGHRAK
jgi:hypothetical protein